MTPFASIKVIGARKNIELTALVDTGFSGDVCVPVPVAVQLGLELIGEQIVELADGSRHNERQFAARVEFFGQQRDIELMVTHSEDALIGTRLLNHYRASIEFPGAQVKVVPDRKRRRAPKRRPKQ